MTFNFILPLASFIIVLCEMKLDKMYFYWTIITVANTIVFNIYVYKFPPIMVKKEPSKVEPNKTLTLNEDIYSFFWVLCLKKEKLEEIKETSEKKFDIPSDN